MKNALLILTALILLAFVTPTTRGDAPPLFPFLISYDGPDNASSMAHLLDAPVGKHGFLRAANGRFVNDAGPVRLHATNLTGPANFPTHDQADRLAARLARFGINCVRLHHMDTYWKWLGIIADDPTTQRNLDPGQLERLDYLIAALKRHGIYVDMNLHVGRWWDDRDGFSDPKQRPGFDKGLDNFEPRMIELQREYARKLLRHVNRYTGKAYAEEPCVALVELNNENSLFQNYLSGAIDRLPERYAAELRRQWNDWLRHKYGSTQALFAAWKHVATPLGAEQVPEGRFDRPVAIDGRKWILSLGGAQASAIPSGGALVIRVVQEGGELFPKLFRTVSLKKDQVYTLSFRLRTTGATPPVDLGMAVADTHGGWRSLGLHQTLHVGPAWKAFCFSFLAGDDADQAQFQLTRFKRGAYELDDLSFRSGAHSDLTGSERLEDGNVPTVKSTGYAPLQATRDFYQFMFDTEQKYWLGMYEFLKRELGVKSLISGTQLGYSPPYIQAQLDYVDDHSYWCHPSGADLLHDRYHWQIGNESMIQSLSCIRGLATRRVLGKPFTVSEYNHPFPNQYGAEGHPMLCAYGRLQGWDGVFQYTYNHHPNFEPTINPRYFDMIARTDVLAHLPACAAMFLRGDVQEAQTALVAATDYERYFDRLVRYRAVAATIEAAGFDGRWAFVHRTAVDLSDKHGTDPTKVAKISPQRKVFVSDTGQLCWNVEQPGAGYLTVDTPNTKLFTGYPAGRTFTLGPVTLAIGKTRLDWATVSLVSRRATGFGEARRPASILVAATGLTENKGMTIERLSGNSITIRDQWGQGPVMAEGIPATVTLAADVGQIRCFALDPGGNRKQAVPVEPSDRGSRIVLKPEYQTVWYEIDVR
jgi:hypothetical protein